MYIYLTWYTYNCGRGITAQKAQVKIMYGGGGGGGRATEATNKTRPQDSRGDVVWRWHIRKDRCQRWRIRSKPFVTGFSLNLSIV